jgi:hypothetical protein
MLEVLGVKNVGKLIPTADDQKPKDPVAENMAILNGKPVKAFIYQDHEAHIKVHMAAMQDPKIAQLVNQNPQAPIIQAAALAHINEHIGYQYRKEIEAQLGAALPEPDQELPPNAEFEISKLMAQAAEQLLQKNQGEAAQQQAQQQMQDPIVQMQQQELQIKQQEVEIKAQKTMADIEIDKARLQLEKAKMDSQERIEGVKIGAKVTFDKEKLQEDQKVKGVQIGYEATKSQLDRQHAIELAQINKKEQTQQPKE